MNFAITVLDVTSSTMDDARAAAEQGAPDGTVIQALWQESARGRRGRAWDAPAGNLYMSVLLRVDDPATYAHYSFVSAVAIAEALADWLPADSIKLKWPNDVLVEGKKICGILLEAVDGFLIVGIGLNLSRHPNNVMYPVTDLAAVCAHPPTLDALRDRVLAAFGAWRDRYAGEGFVPVRAAWLAQARSGAMRVKLPEGEIAGNFDGLDAQGQLLMQLDDGTPRVINTGDVIL